jgi:hypothetical protein
MAIASVCRGRIAAMAAQVPGVPPTLTAVPSLAAVIENLDPEVREAIGDVDRTLIHLSLQQSPWNRLRSASRMAQALARIRDAAAWDRNRLRRFLVRRCGFLAVERLHGVNPDVRLPQLSLAVCGR